MKLFNQFFKYLPTFLLSLALAIAVWVSAVTANDPIEVRTYPYPITIEYVGLDPAMIANTQESRSLTLRLSAPRSVWEKLTQEQVSVRAFIYLSGLSSGQYTLPVQVQIDKAPVRIVSYSPQTLSIQLDELATETLPIGVVQRGEPAIGYDAGIPSLSMDRATISGPKSVVERVKTLRVVIDLNKAVETITRNLAVQAVDENGLLVSNLTISPAEITVVQPISQRGGYRNVVVKVVTTGQVASGYRLTSLTVSPPAVTVFASNPTLVENLPGYVETNPVDLNGITDDLEVRVALNLPEGITVVGDQTVSVIVGVSAIEGSVTLSDLPIEVINLNPEFSAQLAPKTATIILSGPLPTLDNLKPGEVRVVVDLEGVTPGTYKLVPRVEVLVESLRVESILPNSIEVIVTKGTPTPRPPGR